MFDFKVGFALLLYDEFDGAPINDENVLFRHEGRIVTPLRKREGFYVFRDFGEAQTELEISRPHYRKKIKRIVKSDLEPGNPVMHTRLHRAHPGNFADNEWLCGNCPPNSEVIAFSRDKRKVKKHGEDSLAILGGTAAALIGRRFAFDTKSGETFLLIRMTAPGIYLTGKNIHVSSSEAPGNIVRVYRSKSGPDGRYHIPVEFGQCENISGTAYYDRGKSKWVCV
jgi:hypothetical protein